MQCLAECLAWQRRAPRGASAGAQRFSAERPGAGEDLGGRCGAAGKEIERDEARGIRQRSAQEEIHHRRFRKGVARRAEQADDQGPGRIAPDIGFAHACDPRVAERLRQIDRSVTGLWKFSGPFEGAQCFRHSGRLHR